MQTKIASLLKKVSDDDRVELVMLNNGYVAAMNEHKNANTGQTLKSWRAIKNDLVGFISDLEEKYQEEAQGLIVTPTPIWQTFTDTKVKLDVLSFLQEAGWEIKKQTFYNHCKQGKCTKNRSGLFTKSLVKKYAEKYLVHSGLGKTVDEETDNLATQKLRGEISRIEAAAEHDRYKLDILKGKHIELSKLEMELASRAVVLDSGLEYLFKTNLSEMVAIVGSVQDKAPLLLDLLLKKKDEQMSLYANFEDFTVVFEGD